MHLIHQLSSPLSSLDFALVSCDHWPSMHVSTLGALTAKAWVLGGRPNWTWTETRSQHSVVCMVMHCTNTCHVTQPFIYFFCLAFCRPALNISALPVTAGNLADLCVVPSVALINVLIKGSHMPGMQDPSLLPHLLLVPASFENDQWVL